MKNHLETAPVIEAFSQSADCPLCRLRAMLEQESIKRCLGGAVMEPSIGSSRMQPASAEVIMSC